MATIPTTAYFQVLVQLLPFWKISLESLENESFKNLAYPTKRDQRISNFINLRLLVAEENVNKLTDKIHVL